MNYAHMCSKVLFLETGSEDINAKSRTEHFKSDKIAQERYKYLLHCKSKFSNETIQKRLRYFRFYYFRLFQVVRLVSRISKLAPEWAL